MMMRKLISLLFILALSACATSNQQVKYYSLTLNSDSQTVAAVENSDKALIIIDPILLADFLRQRGMVMQLGNYEIITANYHQWAGPLDKSIAELLRQTLNNKSSHYHFETRQGQWSKNRILNLKLDFEKFHATDHSTVIIAGRYWLYQQDKPHSVTREFSISDTLNRDGYLHSVEKLEQALEKLADQILETLTGPVDLS